MKNIRLNAQFNTTLYTNMIYLKMGFGGKKLFNTENFTI